MDHHIPRAVTEGVRRRGIDVITAEEDNAARLSDPALLTRAAQLGRALVSQDSDLIAEAILRQRRGEPFAGLIFGSQLSGTVAATIEDLMLIALVFEQHE